VDEISVRAAETRDAPAIARVHVRSWQVGYRGLVPDAVLDALSALERERDWRGWLHDERSSTLVAEFDGAVAGFATTITPSRDEDAGPRNLRAGRALRAARALAPRDRPRAPSRGDGRGSLRRLG
jgi:hypothetical protein